MHIAEMITQGLIGPDVASLALRVLLGMFFVLARFRWVYDPSREQCWFNSARHEHLSQRLCTCGYGKHPVLSGTVAVLEIAAGLAVIFGLLTLPALFGLLAVLAFATWCTAREKVLEQKPVDPADCVSCYLWRVEGCYITVALSLIAMGPGRYSLDYFLWG